MPQQQGSSSSMSETRPSQRFHSLNAEQVEVLHQVLSEVVPIHGRGNFPTLELRPRDIIIAVRARLQNQGITVRDVRLNGSTASHVLVQDNGTSYKDLDVIFGVELPSQEEFQVIKESVLGCLLDCLPTGVNRERISSATMKEAYVQKMVKVFNEHDRWSLISLSNNSGKNLELKFVSTLRRQFEFSVDSFQIILDRLLESYMQQESQHKNNTVDIKDQPAENQSKESPCLLKQTPEAEKSSTRDLSSNDRAHVGQAQQRERHEKEPQILQTEHSNQTKCSEVENSNREKTPVELKETSEQRETFNETDFSDQTSPSLSEKKQISEEAEPPTQIELRHESQISDETKYSMMEEQIQPCDDQQPAHSNHKEQIEQSDHTKHPKEQEELEEQMGQPELPKTSNESQTETLNPPECFGEDQRSDEEEKTTPDFCSSSHKTSEAQLADERKVESKRAERENETEICEVTEEVLESETKTIDQLLGIDCSCSTSSISFTEPAGTQDTLESHSTPHTDNSDKTPNTLQDVSPPDTQDILPAPPGLVSDKKTSSSPSCKASERLSHMVVLKHSSPKPPRRMCRKVAPNPCPSPASESEPVASPSLEPNPSPEPELDFYPKPTAPTSNPTARISGPEPSPSCNLVSNLTSAPDPAPNIISTSAVDPVCALPQESSQPITESSCETSIQSPKETARAHVALDEQSHPSPTKSVSALKQTETLESVDVSSSDSQEPAHTSEVELSDEDENGEPQTKKTDLNQSDGSPQESSPSSSCCLTPPVSCLTPPVLSFSPPCFTPATSFSSPPLSFSPTSSCLSSPPYLTPPMLSLSPPPLCLSPPPLCLSSPSPCLSCPSPCLSPPLLCLTPPVESEDIASQVSPDTEPLILTTDSKEQLKESSCQPETPLLQLKDKKDQDGISSLSQVTEPVSFPITIPSSTSHVLSHSEPEEPGEMAPPEDGKASSSMPENKEAPEAITVMPQQSNAPPRVPDLVPAVEVLAESMYGDFEAAMNHLRYRLIATRNPEEIRGGGLLKYSNLLVRDYRPASETQIKTLERYMCSRFFIDFPDVQEQQRKILSYLKNHFIGEERSKYQYLMTLRRVVDDSTVCLMGHERRQTLNMITVLALKVLGEQNIIPNTDHVTCFYQPAPYLADHSAPYLAEPSYCNYYIPQGGSTLLYQPYPLHLHTQTGLV